MVLQINPMTVEEFEQFVELPENTDKLFEYIGGRIVEVPSNPYASKIGYLIGAAIVVHTQTNDIKGHVTGEAGGYMVSGERYAPDVAFISKERQPELAREGYNPNPPDLAVEVDFPSTIQSQQNLRTKVVNYLAAGTVIWVVMPEMKEVEVYIPGQPVKRLTIKDTLDGGDILPGFALAVKKIFADG